MVLTAPLLMEISLNSASHPILQLRDDVVNFLEAIESDPDMEIHQSGMQFADLLQQLHHMYELEFAVEHIESCYYSPEFIKPQSRN